jgi:general nucleoside transport system ATP-binding protein
MLNKSELVFKSIHKAFGDCVANEEVSFEVKKGTIHAIVGENGAGKSTAMKILYGEYPQDKGEIIFRGQTRKWKSPADAINAGIGMVHQHFMLAETHTALENILLGTHSKPFLKILVDGAEEKCLKIMQEFGLHIPLHVPVGELPVGEQQQIEIMKLLYRDSELLILDEPTAVLTPQEIENFFSILRKMVEKGKTVLIITHKLKEVMALASKVTVLRAGKSIGDREIKDISMEELSSLMVGRAIKDVSGTSREAAKEKILIEAKNLIPRKKDSRLKRVSFRLRSGEILGIAGVEGNGQSELVKLLLNPSKEILSGELNIFQNEVNRKNTHQMRELGVAYFPEDRLKEALLLDSNMMDNYLLGREWNSKFRNGFLLNWKEIRKNTKAAIESFGIRPTTENTFAKDMSGGNQQKLVVARELQDNPQILVSSQPTRGVDIGAVEFIHEKLLELRSKGTGILLVSSELEELMKLSDRILVMFRGEVVGSFLREEFNEKKIGALMAGISLKKEESRS